MMLYIGYFCHCYCRMTQKTNHVLLLNITIILLSPFIMKLLVYVVNFSIMISCHFCNEVKSKQTKGNVVRDIVLGVNLFCTNFPAKVMLRVKFLKRSMAMLPGKFHSQFMSTVSYVCTFPLDFVGYSVTCCGPDLAIGPEFVHHYYRYY